MTVFDIISGLIHRNIPRAEWSDRVYELLQWSAWRSTRRALPARILGRAETKDFGREGSCHRPEVHSGGRARLLA